MVKTITVTEDAYDSFKRMKHGDESFSDVMLRVSKENIGIASKYLGIWKIGEKEAGDIIKNIKKRRMEITEEAKKRQERFAKILRK